MFILIFAHIFLLGIIVERIKSTFSNKTVYLKYKTKRESFLCALMVVCYVSILLLAFSNIYENSHKTNYFFTIAGLIIWGVGIIYRRGAIHALGNRWSIYRKADHLKRVMILGPYQYSRHPYYSASILELLGYSLIFNSLAAFVLTTAIYLPLSILRAFQEEKLLNQKFPIEYAQYRQETPFIFDFLKAFSNNRSLNYIIQLVKVSREYGFQQITKIVLMNRAVKQYFRNYMISQCVGALSSIGMLDLLMEEGAVDIAEFSTRKAFNLRILKIVCDYLYVAGILEKRTLIYSLTPYGKKLFSVSRGVFDFIYAYAPIFENLPDIIRNKKRYGDDIHRRGEFVGRASAELAELFPFPVARTLLHKYRVANILDLGSGSGDFLVGFCKQHGFQGYGIDLSPEAVVYAQKKAEEHGVAGRANFIVGDVLKLKKYVRPDMKIDVITSMFVLHEFLSISEQLVLDVFSSITEAFPGKYIVICELTRCSLSHLYNFPSGVAEHHLFHSLADQGLATREEWKKIFKKAELELIEEQRLDMAEQSIFVLKSKNASPPK